jgi:hypothetical protein
MLLATLVGGVAAGVVAKEGGVVFQNIAKVVPVEGIRPTD